MEDMERYGDYNEVDSPPADRRKTVSLIIKILIITVCISVVAVLLFRVALFNYYPGKIKNIYFNDTLTEYYELNNGNISAQTQKMRAPYDDPDDGNFFCDNLIVIEGAKQLQVSLRYNSSLFKTIEEQYGVKLDDKSKDLFEFKLERVPFDKTAEPYEIGALAHADSDSLLMYTYYKLVFDNVEFTDGDTDDWIRLVVTLRGVEGSKPYNILIYEKCEDAARFQEYKLSSKERP